VEWLENIVDVQERVKEAFWIGDTSRIRGLARNSRLGELLFVFIIVIDWFCTAMCKCMKFLSIWRCFHENFGFSPRNRLAGIKVPPGGTSVWPKSVVSAMNCLSVRLSRQAMYAVLTLFDWTVLHVVLCWLQLTAIIAKL